MENNLVTDFLRNCANQIENGTASVELNVDAINFFCKSRLNISQIEQEEFYKYISLGWYVYQHMDTDTRISAPTERSRGLRPLDPSGRSDTRPSGAVEQSDTRSENKKSVPSEPVNSSNKKL